MPPTTARSNGQAPALPVDLNGATTVNRKKQKRREKQAARAAAEQFAAEQGRLVNGTPLSGDAVSHEIKKQMKELEARFREQRVDDQYDEDNGQFESADGEEHYYSDEGDAFSDSYGHTGSPPQGYAIPEATAPRPSKKGRKGRTAQSDPQTLSHRNPRITHNHLVPLPAPAHPSTTNGRPGISREKIWNTSSQEERERIKEFWLSLGEEERKSLVKVEKDAVLKKMKEQQRHSCSCTVCGRKRTAIEEELEVLYDAYYEELEQYANNQAADGTPMLPPPKKFGQLSGLQPPHRLPAFTRHQQPSRGRIIEQLGDDEDEEGDEEYSDEEAGEEDDYSGEEPEEPPRSHATDFFNFGNSLTVQG